jgi:hypothetical protein
MDSASNGRMSRRRPQEERLRKVPVSVTMDRELYDFIETLIANRSFKDRTHVVNAAVDYLRWTLQNNPMAFFGRRGIQQSPQQPQQGQGRDPHYPR